MFEQLSTLLIVAFSFSSFAQVPFDLTIEEVDFPNSPGLQSYVVGEHDGKWLMIGGRTDGLHQRQPFASFQASGNNLMAYVVDPVALQIWSSSITSLPTVLEEQLQSTNMEFVQRDTVLYIAGGYGYSATAADHTTFSNLVAVNVPSAMQSVMNGSGIENHVNYVQDESMAVTGGYMGLLNDRFYLVCGQYFEGRYNPMGPNHGPGFVQNYTEAIRSFDVDYDGSTVSIQNLSEIIDTQELHRRDYNMVPQIFHNGDTGFTVFSGVFQHDVDLPWHNTVDVTANGYTVNDNFDQMLSQYHSANLPIYDANVNEMHTLFFGGMSRYQYDVNSGNLLDDPDVPFVKTISLVTRASDGSMTELDLDLKMPAFLGSGAEFIPDHNAPYMETGILNLSAMPQNQQVLVGYIYGGIESSAENIFFINTGTQSWASDRLLKIYITAGESLSIGATPISGEHVFTLNPHPNPAVNELNVELISTYATKGELSLIDTKGQVVMKIGDLKVGPVTSTQQMNVTDLPAGNYFVKFSNGAFESSSRVVINP